MTSKTNDLLSHHIFEIRFKASPKVLDFRGEWTNYLSTEMNLPHWKIGDDRIDLFSEKDQAFLSFKNCGFVSRLPDTQHYFQDQAMKLLRIIFRIQEFKPTPVTRLGVRSTFLKSCSGNFESLSENYQKKVVRPTDEVLEILGGQLVDVGAPLNFKDGGEYFNTMSGPVGSTQIRTFFPDVETTPDLGIFFEIDYFKQEIGDAPIEELCGLIKSFAQKSRQKMDGLIRLLSSE